ncbi:hypothetical protein P879_00657 [Paragonimus westermani]|uniref:Cation-transporting P-type ATPase C-terminal domain-containing protein n=1 Tax=Paragonimus westermani TaxID=34504 RepID=A0A8T0DX20_9TREM|nr:hypothetical protein P879_00657 [Paragonimus westermani]
MPNCSGGTDVYEPNNTSVCFTRLTVLVDIVKDVIYSQLIFYLVLISFTYANFGQRIWKFRWSTNPSWCFFAFIFLVSQSVFIIIRCFQLAPFLDVPTWHTLSPSTLGFGLIWCPLLILINELVAWKEQQLLRTEHRLARLYFGTKLGMYSPV